MRFSVSKDLLLIFYSSQYCGGTQTVHVGFTDNMPSAFSFILDILCEMMFYLIMVCLLYLLSEVKQTLTVFKILVLTAILLSY